MTVETLAPLVNTVSAEQFTTFTSQSVSELPLQRRNFTGILAIGTGIAIASGGSSEGVRMNGVGRAGTGISVDGTDAKGNLESRGGQNIFSANYIDALSVESIAEVNVVKGVLPAEYGGVLGGQVNVMTRSGTNEWHGSLFENYQSAALNARDPFLTAKPPFVYNQFGGSIGGPIVRNRIFIFGAYEGYRESRFRRVEGTVPTPFFRDMMVRAVPQYAYSLEAAPLPTEPHAPEANTGRAVGTASDWRKDNHVDLKGDLKLTNNSNIAITYTRGRPSLDTAGLTSLVNPEWTSRVRVKAERVAASYVVGGSTWSSESRVGYNLSDTENFGGVFEHLLDPEDPNERFLYGRRVGAILTNLGFSTPTSEQVELLGPTWTLSEKFAKHVRNHSLKFGAQLTRQCCRRGNVEPVRWTYQGLSDLLNNIPSRVDIAFGQGDYDATMWDVGFFIQDDWRIHPRLTLNLGLRYDVFTKMVAKPRGEGGSFLVNPDGMDMQFNVGPIRPWEDPYESDLVNIGPRFGLAFNMYVPPARPAGLRPRPGSHPAKLERDSSVSESGLLRHGSSSGGFGCRRTSWHIGLGNRARPGPLETGCLPRKALQHHRSRDTADSLGHVQRHE